MKTAFVAIGGNLIPEGFHSLEEVMAGAMKALSDQGLRIAKCSQWFETAPVPISDQPWFLNAVMAIETTLSETELLKLLHEVEANFGRVRTIRNEARILDLDLIDYAGLVRDDEAITIPHPRMHLRAFVLLPIQDLDANWRHPVSGTDVTTLIAHMPEGQDIRPKA